MASSDLKFKRTITDRVSVKGVLSEDGTGIYYIDENKNEQFVTISDLMDSFKDQEIDFTVAQRMEEDLDINSDEE